MANADDNCCAVCMDELDGGVQLELDCGHTFHTKCVLPWFAGELPKSPNCPTCRKETKQARVLGQFDVNAGTRSVLDMMCCLWCKGKALERQSMRWCHGPCARLVHADCLHGGGAQPEYFCPRCKGGGRGSDDDGGGDDDNDDDDHDHDGNAASGEDSAASSDGVDEDSVIVIGGSSSSRRSGSGSSSRSGGVVSSRTHTSSSSSTRSDGGGSVACEAFNNELLLLVLKFKTLLQTAESASSSSASAGESSFSRWAPARNSLQEVVAKLGDIQKIMRTGDRVNRQVRNKFLDLELLDHLSTSPALLFACRESRVNGDDDVGACSAAVV
jgi:hypothetical protein